MYSQAMSLISNKSYEAGYTRLTADLSDDEVLKAFKTTLLDINEYEVADFLSFIDCFVNADKVRKTDIVRRVLDVVSKMARCEDACTTDLCQRRATEFFVSLLEKDLITAKDSRMCISELRKKDLRRLIPLVILKENGYF